MEQRKEAFKKLKSAITIPEKMSYFDPNKQKLDTTYDIWEE